MKGHRSRIQLPVKKGIACIGDSNTHMSYMGLSTECEFCVGVSSNYSSRWTQKLEADTGWRIVNRAQDGAQTEDFLGRGTSVLGLSSSEMPRGWLNINAKYYICCFGLNETALSLSQFKADLKELVTTILNDGSTPILMTNVSVFFDSDLSVSWYNTDRNITIDSYDDQMRDLSSEISGVLLVDVNQAFKDKIAIADYDHRIRQDGTLDNSLDGSHTGDPDFADWRTNIHFNDAGAQIVSDTICSFITSQSLSEI